MKINKKAILGKFYIIATIIVVVLVYAFFNGFFAPKITFNEKNVLVKGLDIFNPIYSNGQEIAQTGEYEVLSENSNFKFEYEAEKNNIRVTNKQSLYVWSNMFDTANYEGKVIPKIKRDLSTLFVLGYTDFLGQDFVISSNHPDFTRTSVKIKNGVAITFYAETLGISLVVEMWLDEDNSFYYRIPRDKISDNSKDLNLGITFIDIMPTFGAAGSNEEGYFIYPDGSGSTYNFVKQSKDFNTSLTKFVYGDPLQDHMKLQDDASAGIKQVIMPYFGSVKKNDGFVGYIAEGEYAAKMNLIPFGVILKLNRISASFDYRKYYTLVGPDGKIIYEVNKTPSVTTDITLRYSFESSSNANYSGLASNLRSWMIKNKLLSDSIKNIFKTEIEYIMGVPEKGMFMNKIIPMTTLDDAKTITDDIASSVVNKLEVVLTGWQKNGYGQNPSHSPTNSKIGSTNDLKSFTLYMKSKDISTTLNENYYLATAGAGGFSPQTDIILNQSGIPVTDENGKIFFLNPFKQYFDFSNNQIKKLKSFGAMGIMFDGLGVVLLEDYNKKSILSRKSSMLISQSFLKRTQNEELDAVSNGGNSYALPYSRKLYNIPDKDSKYRQMTRYIPFYQLVVNGSIPYTSDTPINLASEYQIQKLRCIESASRPYFVLTKKDSSELNDSYVNDLFSTKYDDWKDIIKDINNEFSSKLEFIYTNRMIKHSILENGLILTQYADGQQIYINFSDNNIVTDRGLVLARNYLIFK